MWPVWRVPKWEQILISTIAQNFPFRRENCAESLTKAAQSSGFYRITSNCFANRKL